MPAVAESLQHMDQEPEPGLCKQVPSLFSSFVDASVDCEVGDRVLTKAAPPPVVDPQPVAVSKMDEMAPVKEEAGLRTWLPPAQRLIAIGDRHGDLAKARAALPVAGVIDENDHRVGGETVVVQNMVHRPPSSNIGTTAQTLGGLLLSDRKLWKSRQHALSGENGPSNDEADIELVEVTVLCAHNLKNLRCLGNMNPRAELYIDKDFIVNTLIHFNGGKNPHWNYSFWFKIDETCFQLGHLSIKIYDWSCVSGNRLIGTARIPISDLSGLHLVKEFFSYQVQVPRSGKFEGVVHVLLRRARKAMVQMADPFTDEPWKRYKAGCLEFPYPGM